MIDAPTVLVLILLFGLLVAARFGRGSRGSSGHEPLPAYTDPPGSAAQGAGRPEGVTRCEFDRPAMVKMFLDCDLITPEQGARTLGGSMIPPDHDDDWSFALAWICVLSAFVLIALLNGVHP